MDWECWQRTATYHGYKRDHEIVAGEKLPILGSSDSAFRGDKMRYNPEELLVAALSGCHMLWYLHLCADAGIVVTYYLDEAQGTMIETEDGSGRFTEVILRPKVRLAEGTDRELADALARASTSTLLHCQLGELSSQLRGCD